MPKTARNIAYDLHGDVLQACSCEAICPCCIAADPHGGTCDNFTAYHIRRGVARGVDLSGLHVVSVVHIPGNLYDGNWREVLFTDDKASDEQHAVLLDAFQGRLGGPLADIAALTSERVATYRVPITYQVVGGAGVIQVSHPAGSGYAIDADVEPFPGPDGEPARLVNSTVPGIEATVGKAHHNRVNVTEHGMTWTFEARHAANGLNFHLAHTEN